MAGRRESGAAAGGGGGGGDGGKRPGGHVARPMYEPINTSAPSKADLELDAKLEAFMADNVPVMTSVDLRRREQVLGKIRAIFLKVRWHSVHSYRLLEVGRAVRASQVGVSSRLFNLGSSVQLLFLVHVHR